MQDEEDVPYGEDFHDEAEASAWAEAANRKRPWRAEIFERFARAVLEAKVAAPRVLELGSGPGFLAEHVLGRCATIARYTLLDFSSAMLAQSRHRLSLYAEQTTYLQADFKRSSWPATLYAPFDFVFSLQAVHELRHKRHALRLYEQIRPLLASPAQFVVCDHLPDGAHTPRHRVLYMTVPENLTALAAAGFLEPEVLWSDHAMAMYRARC